MCSFSFAALPSLDEDDNVLNSVETVVADPLEGWNRLVFGFNDGLLEYVARPVSVGYAYVTPQFLRTGISNVFHNLLFPVRFVNNLMQGKGLAAGVEMSRFVLNTTAGLGGFIDVAKHHKPIVSVDDDEDMGQTFGVWGIGDGFYIVWPFFGPSTLRDSVGMTGDYFLSPVSYVTPTRLSLGISAVKIVNELDEVLERYDQLKRAAIEPYSSFRDGYIQYRRAKIAK
jgi:phospholipid-binding lipoprotein MlaA